MSEYGKRSTPVPTHTLSPDALARWRERARSILNHEEPGGVAHAEASPPDVDAVHAPPAGDATQRRHAARQKTLMSGKVVFDDMMTVYDCVIRDLSETGARIKLSAPVQVPQVFMLRFSDGRIRNCKVRRRNGLELGIAFIE